VKSFVLLGGILAGLYGWLVVSCIQARADTNTPAEQQFLSAAHSAGYQLDDDQLLSDGKLVCEAHRYGINEELIGRGIVAAQRILNHETDIDVAADQKFVALAVDNLCAEDPNP